MLHNNEIYTMTEKLTILTAAHVEAIIGHMSYAYSHSSVTENNHLLNFYGFSQKKSLEANSFT